MVGGAGEEQAGSASSPPLVFVAHAAKPEVGPAPLVLIAHATEDADVARRLREQLDPFVGRGWLAVFASGDVDTGDRVDERRADALEAAAVAVLVVSSSFLRRPDLCRHVPRLRGRGVAVLFLPAGPCGPSALRLADIDPDGGEVPATPWQEPLRGLLPLHRQDEVLAKLTERVIDLLGAHVPLQTASPLPPRPEPARPDPARVRYLEHVARYLRAVQARQGDHDLLRPLGGGGALGRRTVARHAVPLEVLVDADEEEGAEARAHGRHSAPLFELLDRSAGAGWTPRWVVRGEPGVGKTTLLREVAAELAAPRSAGQQGPRWLPVFVRLPEWGSAYSSAERTPLLRHALGALPGTEHDLAPALEQARRDGELLLLLDGLDEVSTGREELLAALKLLLLDPDWAGCPVVVTTRTVPYTKGDLGDGFGEAVLRGLDGAQREALLRGLFEGTRWPDEGVRTTERLLRSSPEELKSNPLFVTLLALLAARCLSTGQAPRATTRAGLLDELISVLLEGRGADRGRTRDPERARLLLEHLAFEQTRAGVLIEETSAVVKRLRGAPDLLESWQPERGSRLSAAEAFLADVEERSGLLQVEGGRDRWSLHGWWHRTLQEALAARALLRTDWRARARTLAQTPAELARWAEPYALLAGLVPDTDRDALVVELADANPELGRRALATAGQVSAATLERVLGKLPDDAEARGQVYLDLATQAGHSTDAGAAGAALDLLDQLWAWVRDQPRPYADDLYFLDEAMARVGELCPTAVGADVVARRREALFKAIPLPEQDRGRFETVEVQGQRLPLRVTIPAGSFLMGTSDEDDQGEGVERPQHRVTFARPFALWRVPVTNAQYLAFDHRHEPARWEGITEPELAWHPVVGVSWHAATAFCRWLSLHGWARTRLPSETEWEYAARGGKSTRYWSGDGHADLARVGWYGANSGSRTHRVGELPPCEFGETHPFGLHDVHGNVWEWVQDTAAKYEAAPSDASPWVDTGVSIRVFRGGGWGHAARGCRAASRGCNVQAYRRTDLGFRPAVTI